MISASSLKFVSLANIGQNYYFKNYYYSKNYYFQNYYFQNYLGCLLAIYNWMIIVGKWYIHNEMSHWRNYTCKISKLLCFSWKRFKELNEGEMNFKEVFLILIFMFNNSCFSIRLIAVIIIWDHYYLRCVLLDEKL